MQVLRVARSSVCSRDRQVQEVFHMLAELVCALSCTLKQWYYTSNDYECSSSLNLLYVSACKLLCDVVSVADFEF